MMTKRKVEVGVILNMVRTIVSYIHVTPCTLGSCVCLNQNVCMMSWEYALVSLCMCLLKTHYLDFHTLVFYRTVRKEERLD